MTLGSGRPSSVEDVPSAPPVVEAPVVDVVIAITSSPPPPVVLVQEVAPIAAEESEPATLAGSIVGSSSTVVAPLLSACVATTSASMAFPHSSLPPMVPLSTALASTSTSYHPHVSLDHIYTSNDVDSLWSMEYKPE